MIGEMYTPPMHRDLISSGMPMYEFAPDMMGIGSMYGPMGMGMGMGMYNTNYLGGVSLKPNLSRDTVNIMRSKDNECKKDMINFGKIALGVIGLSILTGLFKGKKTPWYSKLSNWTSGHTPTRPTGAKSWYKPWTWLNKPATP